MTVVDVERELRDVLADRAASLPEHPDPWARYRRSRRTHLRRAWLRRGALLAGAAAIALSVMLNVVPVPSVVPVVPVGPTSTDSLLWRQPTQGSLASDNAWLDSLRRGVQDVSETEGVWRVAGRDRIHVVFAGDVEGRRIALLVVPLRLGVIEAWDTQWYVGDRSAPAGEMAKDANFGELPDAAVRLDGSVEAGGTMLIVAPRGASAEVSAAADYGADGRLHRTWQPARSAEGALVAHLPVGTNPNAVAVRARAADNSRLDAAMTSWSWGGELDRNARDHFAVTALAGARGPGLAPALARLWIGSVVRDTGVDPSTALIEIPWTGRIRGKPAALITAQPPGGGVLVYAFHGRANAFREDLRLLTPAAGADLRPIAYRLRADGADTPSDQVVVVAPPGTARVDLRAGSDPVAAADVGIDGSATLWVPGRRQLTVRAYGAGGQLIAQAPVASLSDGSSGLPGEDRSTRLVN